MSKDWAEADEETFPDVAEASPPEVAPTDKHAADDSSRDGRRDSGGYSRDGGGGGYGRDGGGYSHGYDSRRGGGGYDNRGGGGSYDGGGGRSYGGGGREHEQVPVPDAPPFKALVGNLPYSVHDQDIFDFFGECDVVDIYLVKDRETGDMKGFGYVTFKEKEGLLKALSMANGQLGGRNIRVEVARPQRGGGNRRGGYNDGGFGGSFGGGRRGYEQPYHGGSGGGGGFRHGGGMRDDYGGGRDGKRGYDSRGYEYSHGYSGGGYRGGGGGRDSRDSRDSYGGGGFGRDGRRVSHDGAQPGYESFGSRGRDKDDRSGGGVDKPGSSTGREGAPGGNVPVSGERRRLKLEPRTKPTKTIISQGGSTARKASIFGDGKAHDEFAYEKAKAAEAAAGKDNGTPSRRNSESSSKGEGGELGGGGRGGRNRPGRGGIRGGSNAGGNRVSDKSDKVDTPKTATGPSPKPTGPDVSSTAPVMPSKALNSSRQDGWQSAKPQVGKQSHHQAGKQSHHQAGKPSNQSGGKASVSKSSGNKSSGGKAAPVAVTTEAQVGDSTSVVDNKFSALNVDDDDDE